MSRLALLVLEQACVSFETDGKGDLAKIVRAAIKDIADRPLPDVDQVPIPADVWRRIKAATGYGSFECDEHVASAIEGLLKETRIAMPYANEIENLVRALAPIAEIGIDERFDPMESWRGIVKGVEGRIARLVSAAEYPSELAGRLADDIERQREGYEKQFDEYREICPKIEGSGGLLVHDLRALVARDEARRAEIAKHEAEIGSLYEQVARVNAELDAMGQRAVMPTFELESDLTFLETPLPEPEPVVEGEPKPEDLAPEPEEPKGEPVDPAVGTGTFVAAVPAPIAPTPKPGRKPRAAMPDADAGPAIVATTGGWSLYASPEQAVAIARMVLAGVAPESISKQLDARPVDVKAVQELVSADLARVRKMLPMQREQWLENKGKAWRKSFEGKEAAVHG